MNTIQVRNPRTGENDYSFEVTATDEISSIAAELRQNQANWAAKSIDERADVLDQWAKMVAESDELLEALIADTGRYFICTGEVAQMTKMHLQMQQRIINGFISIHQKLLKNRPSKQLLLMGILLCRSIPN